MATPVIDHATHAAPRRVALSAYLAVAYTLLIAYASLNPFTGWRVPQGGVFAFLITWPRHIPSFDLAINVAAYVPFGLLIGFALARRWRQPDLLIVVSALGILLSTSMETLQALLPGRIASVVDVLTNGAGTALGALAGPWLGRPALEARAFELRDAVFLQGRIVDWGLALIALWLFAHTNPALPFMALWVPDPEPAWPPPRFSFVQMLAAMLSAFAVGTLLRVLLQPARRGWMFVLALAALTWGLKWLSSHWLLRPELALEWASREAVLGAGYGLLFSLLAALARLRPQIAAIAAALALSIALVWASKQQASPAATLAMFGWRKGHLLSFNGLTQAVAALWPWLALAYLALFHRRLGRR